MSSPGSDTTLKEGLRTVAKSKYEHLYESLLTDVQHLKRDLESMAGLSKHTAKDAFWDAADMTKSVLEVAERRDS